MPVDTKRICAPESTTPYRLYSSLNVKTYEQLSNDVLNGDGTRKDKRKFNEPRDIFGRVGVVSQAKGSAYIEMGNTKVVASVFEPREIPKQTEFCFQGELFCEFKYAPFSSTNRCQLQPGNEEREMAASIRRALEPTVLRHLFENFQIDLYIYVLENDGSCLSTAINAIGLALADAEIPIFDVITAVTVGIQGNKVFIDPTAAEEKLCMQSRISGGDSNESDHGIAVMATLPVLEQVTEFWQHGALTLDTVLNLPDKIKPITQAIYTELKNILIDKVDHYLERKTNENKSEKKLNSNANINNK